MTSEYDLLVIGTGTAARVAAMRVRKAGWRIGVIDNRPYGGTCALRGCDPKKLLRGGAEAVDHAWRLHGKGVAGEAAVNWRELLAFKSSFTDPVPDKHERSYREHGIDTYHGSARFTGSNSLSVGPAELRARKILIASGAEPVPLGIPGEEHLLDNEGFLTLARLPGRLVLVGGGYIAAEFSHIAARAGAHVTILQRSARLLRKFDPDLVGWLAERFEAIGIDVQLGTIAEAVERTDTGFLVRASTGSDRRVFSADAVVHAAGRRPALETLGLEAAGLAHEEDRLKLNAYLQSTSNEAVYAAGDAAQAGPALTPVSSHDAKVVAANLIEGNHVRPDYRGVPSVAFTLPPIASVGLSEQAARDKGLRFDVRCQRTSDWFTARQAGETVSGFKLLIEKGSGRVLGAHLVGPHVDEVINIFALAIRHRLPAEQLESTLFAYPTGASDISSMLR